MADDKIILPEGEDEESGGWTPTVVFDPTVREITETTLADAHAPSSEFESQLAEGATDLGEGFLLHEEPVLVQRGADGGIVRLTALADLPGVHYQPGSGIVADDAPPMEGRLRPTPVPLSTAEREKLRDILATRLFKNYATEASLKNIARYNPIRDGIPDLPAGSPEHLAPRPGTKLYRASEGQVYQWLRTFVAQRAKVVDTKRYGGGTIADLALRIE